MIAKWHNGAESHEMARAGNWVMVRRPGCIPYTIYAKEWDALPAAEFGREMQQEYLSASSKMKDSFLPPNPNTKR